jgi:PiT family inorganic phosphate transporter
MHLLVILIIGATIFVAYANGANDNFKGVATLFGIGAVNGKARWGVVRSIVLAWVLTLPVAALLAGGIFAGLQDLVGKG